MLKGPLASLERHDRPACEGRSGSERSTEPGSSAKTVASQPVVGYRIRSRTAKKEILDKTRNIPKVIGGVTAACTEMGSLLYSQVMEDVVPVSSTRVAEMVKLLENTFRMINIGLANEMALLCGRMKIHVWEVIDAAATKPFGFMPFYPGPGLGGHCIPVDPHYLSWKTRQAGHEARFIDLAARINGLMPQFVVDKIQTALNDRGKPVKGSRIHVIGVAYKPDVADVRESPALDILALLAERGALLSYTDSLVAQVNLYSLQLASQPQQAAALADCVVIVTAQVVSRPEDRSAVGALRRVESTISGRRFPSNHCLRPAGMAIWGQRARTAGHHGLHRGLGKAHSRSAA